MGRTRPGSKPVPSTADLADQTADPKPAPAEPCQLPFIARQTTALSRPICAQPIGAPPRGANLANQRDAILRRWKIEGLAGESCESD